jgi:hypothetical protein
LAEPTTLPDAFQAKRSSAGFQTIVSNTIPLSSWRAPGIEQLFYVSVDGIVTLRIALVLVCGSAADCAESSRQFWKATATHMPTNPFTDVWHFLTVTTNDYLHQGNWRYVLLVLFWVLLLAEHQ